MDNYVLREVPVRAIQYDGTPECRELICSLAPKQIRVEQGSLQVLENGQWESVWGYSGSPSPVGDWVVLFSDTGKAKIYPHDLFQKRYRPIPELTDVHYRTMLQILETIQSWNPEQVDYMMQASPKFNGAQYHWAVAQGLVAFVEMGVFGWTPKAELFRFLLKRGQNVT